MTSHWPNENSPRPEWLCGMPAFLFSKARERLLQPWRPSWNMWPKKALTCNHTHSSSKMSEIQKKNGANIDLVGEGCRKEPFHVYQGHHLPGGRRPLFWEGESKKLFEDLRKTKERQVDRNVHTMLYSKLKSRVAIFSMSIFDRLKPELTLKA